MNLLNVIITSFPLKFVDLNAGVERTNLGGVVSLGPPVGATTLAQEARITMIANVLINRFLLNFVIKVICR